MRKIFYLSILFLGVITASCSKDEILVTTPDQDAPEWVNEDKSLGGSHDNDVIVVDDGNEDGVDITDPNDDPDGKTKPKKP